MVLSTEAADLHNSSYHIIQSHPIILLINSGRTELPQNVPSGCVVILQKARTIFPDNNIQYVPSSILFPSFSFISWQEVAGSSGTEPRGTALKIYRSICYGLLMKLSKKLEICNVSPTFESEKDPGGAIKGSLGRAVPPRPSNPDTV